MTATDALLTLMGLGNAGVCLWLLQIARDAGRAHGPWSAAMAVIYATPPGFAALVLCGLFPGACP